MKIVLASASPRRRELLHMIGISDFAIIPSQNEEEMPKAVSPAETVAAIALSKGRDVASRIQDDSLIIASDTLVYLDGVPIGKPKDEEDATKTLQKLSGKKHTVYSGIAVLRNGVEKVSSVGTDVYFRSMSDREIEWYVSTGEPMDKAGSYGVQGLGSVFVEKIDGDYYNVIGLPICRLCLLLKEFGIDITQNSSKNS